MIEALKAEIQRYLDGLALIVIFASVAFAGQSIQLNNGTVAPSSIPNAPTNRLEFYIHDWVLNGSYIHLVSSSATGWSCIISSGAVGLGTLACYNTWSTGGGSSNINLASLPTNALYVRCQHDAANKQDLFDAWDSNGAPVVVIAQSWPWPQSTAIPYASEANGAGTNFVAGQGFGGEPNIDIGFMRAFTTLVPLQSMMPTTVTPDPTHRIFEWKFDGPGSPSSTTPDSSGNGYTGTYYNSSSVVATPSYVSTPYQSLVVSTIRTGNGTAAVPVATQPVGLANTLDGTQSFSQIDSTYAVTYAWSQLSGPSTLTWSSTSSGTPTTNNWVSSATLGGVDYLPQLIVTDANSNTATSSVHIGAVVMDSNGLVTPNDPNVTKIFGPMIALGYNPWGFADQWELFSAGVRYGAYVSRGWTAFQWEQVGAGTVSYTWNGTGVLPGDNTQGTTTTAAITSTSTAIPVADVTKLDLTAYPTRVLLMNGNGPSQIEEVRIASMTPGTGSAGTLNVAYDGRGQNAQSWSTAHVGQMKIGGAGTHFLTDGTAPVCPLGAPSPPGGADYTTGSVTLTHGSTSVTGVGTAWTSALVNEWIRVPVATHSSTVYTFVAQVASVGTGTSLTLARAYPSDSDNGTFSTYAIMPATRTIVLRAPYYTDPTGTGEWMWSTTGCESETASYANPYSYGMSPGFSVPGGSFSTGHDIPAKNGTTISSSQYSITDSYGWNGQFGAAGAFYGESLGQRSLYYRSGLTSALTAARALDNHFINSPFGNQEGAGGEPLTFGGGLIGGAVAAILDDPTPSLWPSVRAAAARGEYTINQFYNGGTPTCEVFDSRDAGYSFAWVVNPAIYDPNSSFQTRWQGDMITLLAVDNACHRSDYSWSHGFLWNQSIGPLTMTNNSTAVAGTGLSSGNCNGTAMGTGHIAHNGSTFSIDSGTVPAPPTPGSGNYGAMAITGTNGGNPFTGYYQYLGSGSSSVTIAVQWPGDTNSTPGSLTWMSSIYNGGVGGMLAIATSNQDSTDLQHNYSCVYNSPTSLTLDHPWAGCTSGSGGCTSPFYGYGPGSELPLAGYGQQPYQLGIRLLSQNWLANTTVPALSTVAAGYQTLVRNGTQWVHDVGTDTPTLSVNYGRVYGFCEPGTISTSTAFDLRSPGCTAGTSTGGLVPQRQLNAEVFNALSIWYANNPSPSNKAWMDQIYGAVLGTQIFNTGGVYWDTNSVAMNLNSSNIVDVSVYGKYFGQVAAMGMLHRWPAQRLLGVSPSTGCGAVTAQGRVTFQGPVSLVLGTCSSGPTTPFSWATMTSLQWANMTSAQWAGMLP